MQHAMQLLAYEYTKCLEYQHDNTYVEGLS